MTIRLDCLHRGLTAAAAGCRDAAVGGTGGWLSHRLAPGMTIRFDRLHRGLTTAAAGCRDAAIGGTGGRLSHRLAPGMTIRLDCLHRGLTAAAAGCRDAAVGGTGGWLSHRLAPGMTIRFDRLHRGLTTAAAGCRDAAIGGTGGRLSHRLAPTVFMRQLLITCIALFIVIGISMICFVSHIIANSANLPVIVFIAQPTGLQSFMLDGKITRHTTLKAYAFSRTLDVMLAIERFAAAATASIPMVRGIVLTIIPIHIKMGQNTGIDVHARCTAVLAQIGLAAVRPVRAFFLCLTTCAANTPMLGRIILPGDIAVFDLIHRDIGSAASGAHARVGAGHRMAGDSVLVAAPITLLIVIVRVIRLVNFRPVMIVFGRRGRHIATSCAGIRIGTGIPVAGLHLFPAVNAGIPVAAGIVLHRFVIPCMIWVGIVKRRAAKLTNVGLTAEARMFFDLSMLTPRTSLFMILSINIHRATKGMVHRHITASVTANGTACIQRITGYPMCIPGHALAASTLLPPVCFSVKFPLCQAQIIMRNIHISRINGSAAAGALAHIFAVAADIVANLVSKRFTAVKAAVPVSIGIAPHLRLLIMV